MFCLTDDLHGLPTCQLVTSCNYWQQTKQQPLRNCSEALSVLMELQQTTCIPRLEMFLIPLTFSCKIIILRITSKPPVWKKLATCLRTNLWWRPELFSQSLYHQPGYAHHPSSSAWLCLWSVSNTCMCAHARRTGACGRAEYCWRAGALLAGVGFNWNTQWVVWVPVSQWKLHRQAHTDSMCGELLSPEGQQIIKAFTALNTHASCMSHTSVFMYLIRHVLPSCRKDLSNTFSLPTLIWQADCLNIRLLLFWLEIEISMRGDSDTLAAECIYVSLVSIMHAYEYVYNCASLSCCAVV